VKPEVFSSLIESLYEAALNPTAWPRAAQIFARAFATESCAIFQLNLAQGSAGIVGITENFDAKAISDYAAYYHQKDLVAIRMARSGTGRAMLSTDVVREAEFLDSEIFVDFAKPMRLGFCYPTCRGQCCFNADSMVLRRTTELSSRRWRNSRSV